MNILVTGSAGGIGHVIVKEFLKEGHVVYGFDIQKDSFTHDRYYFYQGDVCDLSSYPSLKEVNVVINCAGVQDTGHDIEINLKGTISICDQYALNNPHISAVVNIGSASGHTGSEFAHYAASKGGVIAYTRHLALKLAPQATCNSIDPGGVITQSNNVVLEDPEAMRQIMEMTPLKRWADPEEIAEWVYFVAVKNRFMTGQSLLIDGGEAGYNRFIWPED